MAYTRLKIAIEYDGEEFHTDDVDREHDERRRDALRRKGWIVIVVTVERNRGRVPTSNGDPVARARFIARMEPANAVRFVS